MWVALGVTLREPYAGLNIRPPIGATVSTPAALYDDEEHAAYTDPMDNEQAPPTYLPSPKSLRSNEVWHAIQRHVRFDCLPKHVVQCLLNRPCYGLWRDGQGRLHEFDKEAQKNILAAVMEIDPEHRTPLEQLWISDAAAGELESANEVATFNCGIQERGDAALSRPVDQRTLAEHDAVDVMHERQSKKKARDAQNFQVLGARLGLGQE